MKSLRLTIVIGSLMLITTGCSSVGTITKNNEWFMGEPATADSLKEPCIACGEDWIFIGNEPFAAQKQPYRENGFYLNKNGTNYDTTVSY